MTEIQRAVGSFITYRRNHLGITAFQLASQLGMDASALIAIETGQMEITLSVLESISRTLGFPPRAFLTLAYEGFEGVQAPLVSRQHFRTEVPLPQGLTYPMLEAVLNNTQRVIHRINRNMMAEEGVTLQSLIQGNNFSGIVSNLLSDSFNKITDYKHNNHTKYPDLIKPSINGMDAIGLEIKVTSQDGKGGESHNGHSGWHMLACFGFMQNGDIMFKHIMFAYLNGILTEAPDWKRIGSSVNDEGSQRTETYATYPWGTWKLRHGSAYMDPCVAYQRWRKPMGVPWNPPEYSPRYEPRLV